MSDALPDGPNQRYVKPRRPGAHGSVGTRSRQNLRFKDLALGALVPLTVAVAHESIAQIIKWGIQEHTVAEWAVILAEEAGELQKEMCELHFALQLPDADDKFDRLLGIRLRLYREAIQAATLTLKVAEMMGDSDA